MSGRSSFSRMENAAAGVAPNRISAFEAAIFAYGFLLRRFWTAMRMLWAPMTAAGLVLYVTLRLYLTELMLFLSMPDPRVASFALGVLACGLFVSLFCYAMAVVAITKLILQKGTSRAWVHFKAERQDWRVYAAYLRFLLVVTVIALPIYLLAAWVARYLPVPKGATGWMLTMAAVISVIWIVARLAFLIPPIVASSEGPILRRAWRQSSRDGVRNTSLILLLLIPGLLVELAGEYVFRFRTPALRIGGNLPLADYAAMIRDMLASVVFVISLSLSVTIVLLTAGALAAYGRLDLHGVQKTNRKTATATSKLAAVPAEGLPE